MISTPADLMETSPAPLRRPSPRTQRPCRARADPRALRRLIRRGGAEKSGESASPRAGGGDEEEGRPEEVESSGLVPWRVVGR